MRIRNLPYKQWDRKLFSYDDPSLKTKPLNFVFLYRLRHRALIQDRAGNGKFLTLFNKRYAIVGSAFPKPSIERKFKNFYV